MTYTNPTIETLATQRQRHLAALDVIELDLRREVRRAYHDDEGVSMERLAALVGITRAMISKWIHARD